MEYYPFGLNQTGDWYATISPENKYQYNGKELNTDLGLNWNDYGARWYDAAVGRWNAIDPLAEKYYSISTYAYVANNPLIFVDPNGMEIILSYRENKDSDLISVTYGDDGKLYNSDGSEYKGSNEYILNAKGAIDNLRQLGDENVTNLIDDLITGEERHTVSNFHYKYDSKGIGKEESYNVKSNDETNIGGSFTKFVPDLDRKRLDDSTLSDEEILGHELKHAYNRKHNLRATGAAAKGLPNEEVDGLNFQNVIRNLQGRAPKTTFGKRDVSRFLTPPSEYKNY